MLPNLENKISAFSFGVILFSFVFLGILEETLLIQAALLILHSCILQNDAWKVCNNVIKQTKKKTSN